MRSGKLYGGSRSRLARLATLGVLAAVPLAGCDLDSTLEVRDPELATPGSLDNEEGLPVLISGAFSEFQRAYAGGASPLHDEGVITTSAAFTDEFYSSDTFTTRNATARREQRPPVEGNLTDYTYRQLQRARRASAEAAEAVERFRGDQDPDIPVLRALEAYTYIALGENFCSAVPVSRLDGEEWIDGQPLSTAQLFEEALARFSDGAGNLAAVGAGRALLNLGRFDEAAAAVAGVPTDFVHLIEHSDNTSRQENHVFNLQGNGRWSIADQLGTNGLAFRSANDPRVPWWENPRRGFDANDDLFSTLRYPNRTSNVVLADGIEARLIEAEAALQANDPGTWLDILNELRANVASLLSARYDGYTMPSNAIDGCCTDAPQLEPLVDPVNAQARVDLMFSERGFWLFLTGHRLGDLRRLVRDYGRAQADVFPTGTTNKGNPFGDHVAFVIDFNEVNNSHFNHDMCDPRQP